MKKLSLLILIFFLSIVPLFSAEYPHVDSISHSSSYLNYGEIIDIEGINDIYLVISFDKNVFIDESVSLNEIFVVEAKDSSINYDISPEYPLSDPQSRVYLGIHNINNSTEINITIKQEYIEDELGNHLDGERKGSPSDFAFKLYLYNNNPILQIINTYNGDKTFNSSIEIRGRVYPYDSNLFINNERITPGSDGYFSNIQNLEIGENIITFDCSYGTYSISEQLTIFREKRNSERIINIIVGQNTYMPVPDNEFSSLEIFTFEGERIAKIRYLNNNQWNGIYRGKSFKTGIYLYIIKDTNGKILRKGRMKILK